MGAILGSSTLKLTHPVLYSEKSDNKGSTAALSIQLFSIFSSRSQAAAWERGMA